MSLGTFLNRIRKPKGVNLKKAVLNTVLISAAGLMSGFVIKLLDIYTENLGEIFSKISVWVLICAVISVYSASPKRASLNVFLYCVGMLLTYYLSAELLNRYYSMTFVYGWAVFSALTPVFAFFTWYAKGKGIFSKLIAAAVIFFMLSATVLMFSLNLSDIIFTAVTLAILLLPDKKVKEKSKINGHS